MNGLAQLMKERGYSDRILAERLNVNETTVYSWRIGKYQPRAHQYPDLCIALNCSADELLAVDLKKPRLPRALAMDLYAAVTAEGRFSSETLHQMASAAKRKANGKITEFERWLRELAETVYKIELRLRDPDSMREQTEIQLPLPLV